MDGVSREVSLEENRRTISGDGRWRWKRFAFREGQEITESPDDVEVGGTVIPAARARCGDVPC